MNSLQVRKENGREDREPGAVAKSHRRGLVPPRAAWLLFGVVLFATTGHAQPDAPVIDFEELTPGFLSTELESRGVTFPRSLEVFRCSAIPECGRAHSGEQAVVSLRRGEFEQDPFYATFTEPQRWVSLYARYLGVTEDSSMVTVTMRGRDGSGRTVASRTVSFRRDAPWQLVSIGSPGDIAAIVEVELTGGVPLQLANAIAVDDLSFSELRPPGSSPVDDQPPRVYILHPREARVSDVRMPVQVRVFEERELRTVKGEIFDRSGAQVRGMNYCGSISSGRCPGGPPFPIVYEDTKEVSLGGLENGTYRIEIEACDVHNCSTASFEFWLDLLPPPPPVTVYRMEVNQGVQSSVVAMPAPGLAEELLFPQQLVPGKDTVVRFYVFSDGGSRFGYSADLRVVIDRRDGSRIVRRFPPNAGVGSINVAADPGTFAGREGSLYAMRANPRSSLNYVIPGSLMENASFVELRLREGGRYITGAGQLFLGPALRVGLNVVRVSGPGLPGVTPSSAVIDTNVVRYLQEALPMSEVRVLSTRTLVASDTSLLPPWVSYCEFILWQVWLAYGTDDAPVRSFTSDPHVIPTLGVVPTGSLVDASGCSLIGDPTDIDDRIGGTIVAEAWGDVAAHEFGHRMGLVHASNAHGEADGGDWERWPYPHGTLGDRSFGVITTPTVAPSDFDGGQWMLNVVDPCPAATSSMRYPFCTVTGETVLPHDFMSYGKSTTKLSPLVTLFGNWISDGTHNRFYAAVAFDGREESRSRPTETAAGALPLVGAEEIRDTKDRAEGLLISGVRLEDGSFELLPLLRKPLPRNRLEHVRPGAYNLELYDAAGKLLSERSFGLRRAADGASAGDRIQEEVPFVEGLRRLVITKGGVTVFERSASANAPRVKILSPNGGEILTTGTHHIRWEAKDSDGDPLTFLVQYTPDGGKSWQGIALVAPGNPLEAEVNVKELFPSRQGRIRVTVSDGLLNGIDWSDCAISVGVKEPPVCN